MDQRAFHAVVLAGERPGGSPLARSLGLDAGVLAPLAGKPCIERVLDTLGRAVRVDAMTVCGPAADVVASNPGLEQLFSDAGAAWRAPETGPAASALAAADAAGTYPLLITSGDHGLLESDVVDDFCGDAWALRSSADVVVGLVPYAHVRTAFPHSRRTVLRFADGAYCGSNLFALLDGDGRRALDFWRSVEAERKRPWRMVRRLGVATLLRYLTRRLTLAQTLAALSKQCGCRVGWVEVPWARAAVDVDSEADWRLADRLLGGQGP